LITHQDQLNRRSSSFEAERPTSSTDCITIPHRRGKWGSHEVFKRPPVVAAKPTAAFDAKWGQFVIDPGFFTRPVYEGV
jgi:hypothetical protein